MDYYKKGPLAMENIQKAQASTDDEKEEIRGFLTSIKLEKYLEKFIDNGVDDIETVLEL